jgi:hypothetical protein
MRQLLYTSLFFALYLSVYPILLNRDVTTSASNPNSGKPSSVSISGDVTLPYQVGMGGDESTGYPHAGTTVK